MQTLAIGTGWVASLAVMATASPAAAQEAPAPIEWRVKDRFRLFDQADVEARARVQALADEIGARPDAPFVEFYQPYLDTISGRDGSRAHTVSLRHSNYAPTDESPERTSGRYAPRYLFPETYFVELRVTDADPAATCSYATALARAEGRCGDWTAVALADGVAVSHENWRVSGPVRVTAPGRPDRQLTPDFTDELIVALGDSYISGEGNPDAPSVITDRPDRLFEHQSWGARAELNRHVLREAEWWDEPCHRSLLSWPVIAAFVHAARNPHRAVTLVHLGCSGAIARDIYLHGETELPGGGDERESQLALLDALMRRPDPAWEPRRIDTAFLSVGGNDIGFVGVVTTITLPTNGFTLGPFATRLIGRESGAVCPYDKSGRPLAHLCRIPESAQTRLGRLAHEYGRLQTALKAAGIDRARIFQPIYPNPLIGENGRACDTNPANDEVPSGERPRFGGFEALMGVLPRRARGFRFGTWTFELMYRPEERIDPTPEGRSGPLDRELPIACDWLPERGDSEVCQALWVHARLNEEVRHGRWNIFDDHYRVIAGRGLCNASPAFPLAMPLVQNHRWLGGHTPQSVDPYDINAVRWFRVTNESLVTQYGFHASERRFEHGTVHPTFRAHVAIAEAAYVAAFSGPPADRASAAADNQ